MSAVKAGSAVGFTSIPGEEAGPDVLHLGSMKPASDDDPVFLHSRREAVVTLILWGICAVYSLTCCYLTGYDRDPATIRTYLGVPDWVFFGVFLPWGLANVVAWWFSFRLMTDDDLGVEADEGHPGDGGASAGEGDASNAG